MATKLTNKLNDKDKGLELSLLEKGHVLFQALIYGLNQIREEIKLSYSRYSKSYN